MSILFAAALALAASLTLLVCRHTDPWPMIAALASHGVFDIKQARRLADPYIPAWLALLLITCDVARSFCCKRWGRTNHQRLAN